MKLRQKTQTKQTSSSIYWRFFYILKLFRKSPFLWRTIVFLMFFLLLVKQIIIISNYHTIFPYLWSWSFLAYYLWFFISDFVVCLLVLSLVLINIVLPYHIIKGINITIMISILFLFVLDIFTLSMFSSRIPLLDIPQFLHTSTRDFVRLVIFTLIGICILWWISFLIVQSRHFVRYQIKYLWIYIGIFIYWIIVVGKYAPEWFRSLPENIISLNVSALREYLNPQSSSWIPDTYEKFFSPQKWSGFQPNIIILFVESLSPIDSLRAGKTYNNLPYFDKISYQWMFFPNFINNWCTSDTAHIATLLWIEPIKPLWYSFWAYTWYRYYTDPLPVFFRKQGYSTWFLSTVTTDFLWQNNFLQSLHFDHIIDHTYFSGEKTYVFDAAPDHVLYKKAIDIITSQTEKIFLVMQNISFHKPYFTPYGKTQKSALSYTDKALYYFYLQLKKHHFFDNGILVIVSDHRKMEALQSWELEALWPYRYTRGLATIIGTGIVPWSIYPGIIQHTDLFYNIKFLVAKGKVILSKFYNNIFNVSLKRNRWFTYCRYFDKTNKYTVIKSNGNGLMSASLQSISTSFPFVYKYITTYLTYQLSWSSSPLSSYNTIFIAHQWSPRETPENSLAWFLLAKHHGAQGVEMDVSYTKDKQLVVVHGEQLRATSWCQQKKVYDYTLDYLRKNCPLKNGEPIRTLEEMLKSLDGMFDYYFIDIKIYSQKDTEQQVQDVISTVQKLWMQDRAILSSYDRKANYILWSNKHIIAAWDTFDANDVSMLHNVHHTYFMLPYTSITWSLVQEVEDIGKRFVTYTVNTTGELQALYDQWVRMVMTDNVPLLKWWADENLGR